MAEKMVLTTKELADVMGCSVPTAYDLVHREDGPPVIRLGRSIRIPVDGLRRWLEEQSARG